MYNRVENPAGSCPRGIPKHSSPTAHEPHHHSRPPTPPTPRGRSRSARCPPLRPTRLEAPGRDPRSTAQRHQDRTRPAHRSRQGPVPATRWGEQHTPPTPGRTAPDGSSEGTCAEVHRRRAVDHGDVRAAARTTSSGSAGGVPRSWSGRVGHDEKLVGASTAPEVI